jgi:hypothetical protein
MLPLQDADVPATTGEHGVRAFVEWYRAYYKA